MRRREFRVTDPEILRGVLEAVPWGTLGLVTAQGTPHQVPLNFVLLGHHLYFHGAAAGEKYELLKRGPVASFLVVDAHAMLPSHFFDPEDACPATQFFKSVLVKGRTRLVDDPDEKARALQALMEKLQPEGGHDPIASDNPRYRAPLRGVAVIAMTLDHVTGKFKFGQNLSPEVAERVAERLANRGASQDARTLAAMTRFRSAGF